MVVTLVRVVSSASASEQLYLINAEIKRLCPRIERPSPFSVYLVRELARHDPQHALDQLVARLPDHYTASRTSWDVAPSFLPFLLLRFFSEPLSYVGCIYDFVLARDSPTTAPMEIPTGARCQRLDFARFTGSTARLHRCVRQNLQRPDTGESLGEAAAAAAASGEAMLESALGIAPCGSDPARGGFAASLIAAQRCNSPPLRPLPPKVPVCSDGGAAASAAPISPPTLSAKAETCCESSSAVVTFTLESPQQPRTTTSSGGDRGSTLPSAWLTPSGLLNEAAAILAALGLPFNPQLRAKDKGLDGKGVAVKAKAESDIEDEVLEENVPSEPVDAVQPVPPSAVTIGATVTATGTGAEPIMRPAKRRRMGGVPVLPPTGGAVSKSVRCLCGGWYTPKNFNHHRDRTQKHPRWAASNPVASDKLTAAYNDMKKAGVLLDSLEGHMEMLRGLSMYATAG